MTSNVAPLSGWIWWSGEASPRNANLCFRKTVTLPAKPESAPIRLSADSRYQLWVNGRFVCRGPARYYPEHVCVDEIDLALFLKAGINVLAVLVHHYGESTYDYIHVGQGGLALEGAAQCGSRLIGLSTDESWRVLRHPCWEPNTARLNTRLGFQELYDARRAPGFAWTSADFDDSSWPAAVRLSPDRIRWSGEEKRDVPFLVEQFEQFAVLRSAHIVRSASNTKSPRNLAAEIRKVQILREAPDIAERVRSASARGGPLTLDPLPNGESLALLFELPTQSTGFPFVEIKSESGGEELLWSYAELIHWGRFHQETHPETLFGDLYIVAPGLQEWQTFFPRAFRYVWIVFRNVRFPLAVHRLGFIRTSYPITKKSSFECSDDRLNRVWQVSLDTQANAMAADAYVDSFRERAQWWGTAVIAPIRFNAYIGADLALARRGLRQAAQSQRSDGQIMANFPNRVQVPADSGESVGLVVPDISLQWVMTLWDYYWYSGDAAPLSEHWPAVERLLSWYEARLDDRHLLKPMKDYWVFIDWKLLRRLNEQAQTASLNLFHAMALDRAARIASVCGQSEVAEQFRARSEQVKRAVMDVFYDSKDRYLHEYVLDGRRLERVSLHANVLAILLELPGFDVEAVSKRMFSGTVGYPYWEGPEDADIGFYVFVLEAMCRTGWVSKALDLIRHRWGAMLDCGATNWWEFWSYDLHVRAGGAMSVAWGVSPCLVIIEWMLGLRATAPGFREFVWTPQPCGLEWAKAVVPTPSGSLALSWRLEGNELRYESDMPAGLSGHICFPRSASPRPLPPGQSTGSISANPEV